MIFYRWDLFDISTIVVYVLMDINIAMMFSSIALPKAQFFNLN